MHCTVRGEIGGIRNQPARHARLTFLINNLNGAMFFSTNISPATAGAEQLGSLQNGPSSP